MSLKATERGKSEVQQQTSAQLQDEVTRREEALTELSDQLGARTQELSVMAASFQAMLDGLPAQEVALTTRIAEQQEAVRALQAHLVSFQAELDRRVEHVARLLRGEVEQQFIQIDALRRTLGTRERGLQDIETMIAAKDDRIRALEENITRREQALSAQIAGLQSTLTQVLSSKSWRLTEPLRWVYRRLRPHGTSGSAAIQTGLRPPAAPPKPSSLFPVSVHSPEVRLQTFLAQDTVRLVFPRPEKPAASIVIPTFDKAAFLYQCLESLLAHTDASYEVIIVDDASRDGTRRLLDRIDGVGVILNEENLGFIRSCNRGATFARGRSILFLNNDVTVTPAWLSRLLEPLEVDPTCGGVGAKLVRPDGSLQEAGSVVWQDGTAAGYGRDDHPFKPEYSYKREVDFCSAACLLVAADLFRALGGFDERYLPAYYEDTDLCFGIRRLGRTVVFQPEAVVFHHEYGSGSSAQAKTHCQANAPKFAAKWAEELARRPEPGDVLRGRDRRPGRRVLLIDDRVPAPRLGLGLPRTYRLLEFLSDLGCIVTFIPAVDVIPHQPTTWELQRRGVEVFYGDGFRPEDVVQGRDGFYETVIVSRPHNAERLLELARRHNPNALVVYDAEALFCTREFLKATLEGRPMDEATKREMLNRELGLMRHADIVMTVSEHDRSIIIEKGAHRQVAVWGHALDTHMSSIDFSRRNDLLFVGTLTTGHPPNVDAIVHFAAQVLPRIRARIPNCRLLVVGGDPTESVRRLASDSVDIIGYAEDLRPYYDACRAFVVPNRYGAGISLKLLEAMAHGIPAVISAFSATGLDLRDGEQVLIADNDEAFAEKVVGLYEDESLWLALQKASIDYIRSRYSSEIMRDKLAAILNLRVAAPTR